MCNDATWHCRFPSSFLFSATLRIDSFADCCDWAALPMRTSCESLRLQCDMCRCVNCQFWPLRRACECHRSEETFCSALLCSEAVFMLSLCGVTDSKGTKASHCHCVHVCVRVCVCMRVCVYKCVCVRMCVRACVCTLALLIIICIS